MPVPFLSLAVVHVINRSNDREAESCYIGRRQLGKLPVVYQKSCRKSDRAVMERRTSHSQILSGPDLSIPRSAILPMLEMRYLQGN